MQRNTIRNKNLRLQYRFRYFCHFSARYEHLSHFLISTFKTLVTWNVPVKNLAAAKRTSGNIYRTMSKRETLNNGNVVREPADCDFPLGRYKKMKRFPWRHKDWWTQTKTVRFCNLMFADDRNEVRRLKMEAYASFSKFYV